MSNYNNNYYNNSKRKSVSDEDAAQALVSAALDAEHSKRKPAPKRPRPHRRDDDDRRYQSEDRGYYGPDRKAESNDRSRDREEEKEEDGPTEKQKPDFGLSGALTQQKGSTGGTLYKGVQLKFSEPAEARTPKTLWRFHVFKGEEQIQVLHVSKQSAYLWGRNEDIADIPLQHGSCSSQHAVLQYRALPNKETGKLSCQPYLVDLESTNGTFINGNRIDSARYYQLKKGDVLRFGASTREYVLLTAPSLK